MSVEYKTPTGGIVTLKTIDDLLIAIGEVQPSPTANTLLDRLKALQTLTGVSNTALAALLAGPLLTLGQAGENHLGEVGGRVAVVASTTSRPNDTTAYASGDLVANSTTAGSVIPLAFAAPRLVGGNGKIVRVRLKTTDTGFAGKAVRVHLYRNSPTVTNGDNGAWLTTESDYIGYSDLTLDRHFSDAEKGVGSPATGNVMLFQADPALTAIYGLIEARAAITPIANSAFVVALEIEQN